VTIDRTQFVIGGTLTTNDQLGLIMTHYELHVVWPTVYFAL